MIQVKSEEILDKLNNLDDMFASLASNIEHFSKLATSMKPHAIVSDQALSILQQMEDKQTGAIVKTNTVDQTRPLIFSLDNKGQIEYKEGQFIEDDLNTLVKLRLLLLR